jgi:hypothetical protein
MTQQRPTPKRIMNRHHLFFAMAIALAVGAPACKKSNDTPSEHGSKDEAFGRMSVEEVEAKLKEAKEGKAAFYVFDNNAKSVFDKAHVPGAKWVDHENVKATDLPENKDATLVFYCANDH